MSVVLVPLVIDAVMRRPKTLLGVSISGGKDSQTMAQVVMTLYRLREWRAQVFAIHADLGRVEWHESMAMCESIAAEHNIPLVVVRRRQGDLLARIKQRLEATAGTDKPFWPSASSRYCTSDMKRGPINKHLRRGQIVVSVEGIRREESRARAGKEPVVVRKGIAAKYLKNLTPDEAYRAWLESENGRLAFTWRPILDFTLDDVWETCGTSMADLARRRQLYADGYRKTALQGWPCHPAYVYGNERVSCVLCILGSRNDLQVGGRHRPDLVAYYARLEEQGEFTFKKNASIVDLVEASV